MAPHSFSDDYHHSTGSNAQGYAVQPHAPNSFVNSIPSNKMSHLRQTPSTAVHDLICVGFGPASLAIAIALSDSLEKRKLPQSATSTSPKVLFLEKQHRFAWHAGMLLPGAKMQISFIKDMATLRDPTSKFTFLNYLHDNNRLVDFTNLSTFLPARVEYDDYLRWCARFFDDVVQYGSEVLAISPEKLDGAPGSVSTFTVSSRDVDTGDILSFKAKNVLVAIGGQPSIPKSLPSGHPRIIHSSQYAHLVPKILNKRDGAYRVAVVGAGQSAAEIFNNIQTLYPNSKTTLIMRSEFLKPSDDSPFVNSIFNPSYVDDLYTRSPDSRHSVLADARSTNYGVVRLELIEQLYERMYQQQRELGSDEKKWPHRIMGASTITGFETYMDDKVRLMVRPLSKVSISDYQNGVHAASADEEVLDCDLVIAATGYQRQGHLTMMEDVADLLPEPADMGTVKAIHGLPPNKYDAQIRGRAVNVSRDYSVQFAPGKVAQGSGIWLQGCCEGTHGLSDTLLSILAVRSGEIVRSIFGTRETR
ncbi:L-lysine 6-monooxygenase (NADPH-requiring)-domain-containing protein [Xylariaceae sp. FL0255]|nr:L-lysine 6-monooxygenase (NADPH-requiring)-domain-containing protein [Xylariaceae sp. FL0255]